MLYIETNLKNVDKSKFIKDVDEYFDTVLALNLKPNESVNKILMSVDKAHNLKGQYLETRFGPANIKDLSSGCKALLIEVLVPDSIVNFILVGSNVVKLAVEFAQQMDIHIYTPNIVIFGGFDDEKVSVNGKIMTVDDYMLSSIGGSL